MFVFCPQYTRRTPFCKGEIPVPAEYFPIKKFLKPVDNGMEMVYNTMAGVSEMTAPVRYPIPGVRRSTQEAEEAPLLRV